MNIATLQRPFKALQRHTPVEAVPPLVTETPVQEILRIWSQVVRVHGALHVDMTSNYYNFELEQPGCGAGAILVAAGINPRAFYMYNSVTLESLPNVAPETLPTRWNNSEALTLLARIQSLNDDRVRWGDIQMLVERENHYHLNAA